MNANLCSEAIWPETAESAARLNPSRLISEAHLDPGAKACKMRSLIHQLSLSELDIYKAAFENKVQDRFLSKQKYIMKNMPR